ncbi:hypothetical protein DENIS_0298 [Desulfonema ishimotonii]|uniref:Uncharacterized protein n=1 Tax=Desulfonema ishimotonii TaxID=45657 RepID=A0A401FQW9_9BACT|nr:hypothetical protein DENIS_0298 [Desulfonema ishimotonii]
MGPVFTKYQLTQEIEDYAYLYLFKDYCMTRSMLTDLLKTLDCEVHSFCDPSEILDRPEETR